MPVSRRVVLLGVASLGVAGCAGDWNVSGKNVLFIGNSYTDYNGGLDAMLTSLAPRAKASRIAPGGSTLQQHAASVEVAKALTPGSWDVVVLQDQSQYPVFEPEAFRAGAAAMVAAVRAAKATPMLLATWGRPDSSGVTGAALERAYTGVGDQLTVGVIHAGRAFDESLKMRPDLVLNQSDGHPTKAGTYLAACTAFAAILRATPVGNSAHGGLAGDVAQHLQKVAAAASGF